MTHHCPQHITNVDFSEKVIEQMSKECVAMPEMLWLKMDVMDMSPFEDESFDVAIDKGTPSQPAAPCSYSLSVGTMDALMVRL